MTPQNKYKNDLTGKRYGRLMVLNFDKLENHHSYWKCRCDCGNLCIKKGELLANGTTRSCGCLQRETRSNTGKSTRKHKCTDQKLIAVWRGMIFRCENKKSNRYHVYGGRGIKVCNEWHDVDVFTDWAISNGYKHGLTIDRIDADGMYCPENCRFVSNKVQANNKSRNVIIEYNGEKKTLAEWSEETKIPYGTIRYRRNHKWRVEDIFNVPVSQHNNNINRRNGVDVK